MPEFDAETHPPSDSPEVLRCFSPASYRLISVRADGTTWTKPAMTREWRRARGMKAYPGLTVEAYIALMRDKRARLPDWAASLREFPTLAEMEEWVTDGTCETVDGDGIVECDGYGPTGAPSWLLALGLI